MKDQTFNNGKEEIGKIGTLCDFFSHSWFNIKIMYMNLNCCTAGYVK